MKPSFILAAAFAVSLVAQVAHVAGAAEGGSPWGVSSSASGMSGIGEWMPRLQAAGAGSARLFPEWRSIEPRKGEWAWAQADELVRVAGAQKFRINACLMGSVPWSTAKGHAFPMSDLAAWSDFVGAAVGRYKESIAHWEVWNEGNGGFNDEHHTTADYARLAAATYAAAKKANPAARVGLTTASFDPAYLHQTALAQAAQGTPGHFDFLCIHPYELADAVGQPDGEVPYLWMTKLLRDALKQSAPEKAGAEVWITEVGRNIARRKDQPAAEREAAATLVKLYVLALAQGIRCVEWFEAQDPAREEAGFGLLKRDGSPRAAYAAFQNMTKALGPAPKYLGWLALGDAGRSYGFVFQNGTTPVLVAWAAAGERDQRITLPGGAQPIPLGEAPIFLPNPAQSLVAKAAANRDLAFPWGGDFSKAKTVSVQPGSDAPGAGVFLAGVRNQPKITFPDGTTGILVAANQGTSFYVHPSFASILTREYFVRITVRRVTPGNVGMNLFYEMADTQGRTPYKNTGQWTSLSNEEGWQTFSWHIKDACFAKMWGNDISFRPEQSQPFVIGKVEVSTEPF